MTISPQPYTLPMSDVAKAQQIVDFNLFFDVSTLPEDAMLEINEGIKLRMRFNPVVETGVPGFIPRGK